MKKATKVPQKKMLDAAVEKTLQEDPTVPTPPPTDPAAQEIQIPVNAADTNLVRQFCTDQINRMDPATREVMTQRFNSFMNRLVVLAAPTQ